MSRKRDNLALVMEQGKDLVKFYRENPCIAAFQLLGVDLAPIQRIIFEDMWFKDHVIVVASRGLGKTFLNGLVATLSCLLYPGYRVGLICPSFRQCTILTDECYAFFTDTGMKSTPIEFYDSIQEGVTKTQSLNTHNTILNKWKNPDRECVKITTKKGFEIAGTLDHRVLVLGDDLDLVYKELQDVTEQDYLAIRKGFRLFGDDDKLPTFEFDVHWAGKDCLIPTKLTPELAYLFGLIVGDGCISITKKNTKHRVAFISADVDQINIFEKLMYKYFGLSNPTKRLVNGSTYHLEYYCKKMCMFLLKCGFTRTSALDKKFPSVVRKSSQKCVSAFMSGLLDTDGDCYIQGKYNSCVVGFSTSSIQLAREYHVQLLNFGIISNLGISSKPGKKKLIGRDKYSICSTGYKIRITGVPNLKKFKNEIGFKLDRKNDKLVNYLGMFYDVDDNIIKYISSNVDIVPKTRSVCCEIANRCTSVSGCGALLSRFKNNKHLSVDAGFSIDVVSGLLAVAEDNNILTDDYYKLKKIVDCGLSFLKPESFDHFLAPTIDIEVENESCYFCNGFINHNSKMIFSEIEKLYHQSSILREACEKKPIRQPDSCYLKFKSVAGQNGSFVEALPLGVDGAKIRGSRFYLICIDELAQVPDTILDIVIRPMSSVQMDPMKNVRKIEYQKRLLESGLATEGDFEEDTVNKMVMTSSGFYKFNHMYRRMKSYWDRIEKGEGNKYAVYQIPYYLLPEGFMDAENVKEAERVMSNAEFRMEYYADMVSDSEGFFKASLLESCTLGSNFSIQLRGDRSSKYILGVDPNQAGSASCGMVIVKVGTVNQVVNVLELKKLTTQGLTKMVQDVCKDYNVIRIFMDKGGGGKSLCDLLEEGYGGVEPIIDRANEDHRHMEGRHILEMINFNSAWISDANFGTLSLLEARRLLFPEPPTSSLDLEERQFKVIETLKKQMLNIIVTQTSGGLLHFDTPKKWHNKDLYSALILAGYGVRVVEKELEGDDEPILFNSSGMVRVHGGHDGWNELNKAGPATTPVNIGLNAAVLKRRIK